MPLAIFCDCTDRFASDLVGNPEARFSHNEAQMLWFYVDTPCKRSHYDIIKHLACCSDTRSDYDKINEVATTILPLPLFQEKHLSVNCKRMYT